MNALPIVLLSVGCAIGAGVVTSIAVSPPIPADAGPGDVDQELASLSREVSRLNRELETLRQQDQEHALPGAPRVSARLPVGDIEEAVRRYLDEHLAELAGEGGVKLAAKKAPGGKPVSSQDFLAQLLDDNLDWDAQEEVWTRVRESGKLDEVIALFEARAEENSNDPDAQVDLGHAYLQKIYELGDSPAAGMVAAKADSAYDRALELDERHWSARFSKAVALSFWPPIFGKQQEAVSHFEILVDQQEQGPVEDRFDQSYVLLGNLYHQVGQADKAREAWARGLVLFPDSEELRGKAAQGGGDH